MERCKLVVEGAGAVGVAALLGGQTDASDKGTTVAVLSGGNVDPGLLAAVARRSREPGRPPARAARPACPTGRGTSPQLLVKVADMGANLLDVSHVREGLELHVRETAIELVLETRGHEHAEKVVGALNTADYRTRVLH